MSKYLSVREFSKLAGVSEQSVYKRLSTSLQPYVSTVEGKKKIDITALAEVYNKGVDSTLNNQKVERLNNQETTSDKLLIETLQSELELVKGELETKNEQIKSLSEAVNNLTSQLDKSNAMLLREQELHYLSMKSEPGASEPEEPAEKKRGFFSRFKK